MKFVALFAFVAFAFLAQANARSILGRWSIAGALKAKLVAAKEKLNSLTDPVFVAAEMIIAEIEKIENVDPILLGTPVPQNTESTTVEVAVEPVEEDPAKLAEANARSIYDWSAERGAIAGTLKATLEAAKKTLKNVTDAVFVAAEMIIAKIEKIEAEDPIVLGIPESQPVEYTAVEVGEEAVEEEPAEVESQ